MKQHLLCLLVHDLSVSINEWADAVLHKHHQRHQFVHVWNEAVWSTSYLSVHDHKAQFIQVFSSYFLPIL